MTQEEQEELLNKIWNDGKWGDYCNPNKFYDLTPPILFYHINNLLKSRQEKMIEAIKEMSLCYADDSIENEMDYITGQAHFKQHIIDMFNQGLDKGIEIVKLFNNN